MEIKLNHGPLFLKSTYVFHNLGWNTQFMQDTSSMHFLQIPPFLALQVHYAPTLPEKSAIHTEWGGGNLINGRTNAGEANYPFIPFRIFVRNIYPPIYFPFLCAPSPVHYLRFALMYSPLLVEGPHTVREESNSCSLNLPP